MADSKINDLVTSKAKTPTIPTQPSKRKETSDSPTPTSPTKKARQIKTKKSSSEVRESSNEASTKQSTPMPFTDEDRKLISDLEAKVNSSISWGAPESRLVEALAHKHKNSAKEVHREYNDLMGRSLKHITNKLTVLKRQGKC
ncbi:hypothetical protein HK097_000809 [Rhizophlyctis rosea]|uniref:Myb-like domain-containing protein n=1 Tax=Rhizophlyctis rosea TaxID=64517 RepID=A0AAD5S7E2_9FUNG|nr:hypothetical protein HK097_000809 [Rhizophlyctis rosea]